MYEFIIIHFSNNHVEICTVVIFSLLAFIYKHNTVKKLLHCKVFNELSLCFIYVKLKSRKNIV